MNTPSICSKNYKKGGKFQGAWLSLLIFTILLTWNPNTESDLAGYEVYKKARKEKVWHKINSELVTFESYEDKTYKLGDCYKIKAVDWAGLRSNFSEKCCPKGKSGKGRKK